MKPGQLSRPFHGRGPSKETLAAKARIEEMAAKYGYIPGDALLGDVLGVSRATVRRIRDNGLSEKYESIEVKDGQLVVGHVLFAKPEPEPEPEPTPEPMTLVERIKMKLALLPKDDLIAIDELLKEEVNA